MEPGGIATEWGGIAADGLRTTSGSGAYAVQAQGMVKTLTDPASTRRNSPPTVISDAIAKAVTARRPKTRYVVGFGARPLIAIRRVLSDRAFDRLISLASGTAK